MVIYISIETMVLFGSCFLKLFYVQKQGEQEKHDLYV